LKENGKVGGRECDKRIESEEGGYERERERGAVLSCNRVYSALQSHLRFILSALQTSNLIACHVNNENLLPEPNLSRPLFNPSSISFSTRPERPRHL
jgi:hypothetical protein